MNIKTLSENYDVTSIIVDDPDKEYDFSCALETSLEIEKDFIFIPFSGTEESIFSLIEKAMANPFCKGFVLNRKALDDNNIKNQFHHLMKIVGQRLEALILVNNIYNLAAFLAKNTVMANDFQIICAVGTSDTDIVREMLNKNLSPGFNTTFPRCGFNVWQNIFEPILRADSNTDYVIIECSPIKQNLLGIVSSYKNKHVIFTKSGISDMRIYKDLEDLSQELLTVLNDSKNVLSIFTLEDNELVNSKLFYEISDLIHFVTDDNADNEIFDCFNSRCKSLVDAFLRFAGIDAVSVPVINNLYTVEKFNEIEVFRLNKNKISVELVNRSLKEFFRLYEGKKKIVILEHIQNLGQYKEGVYTEILINIAKFNPDVLILLNTNAYIHIYKRFNKNTFVKTFNYQKGNQSLTDIFNAFFKGVVDNNTAVYIASPQDILIPEGNNVLYC